MTKLSDLYVLQKSKEIQGVSFIMINQADVYSKIVKLEKEIEYDAYIPRINTNKAILQEIALREGIKDYKI